MGQLTGTKGLDRLVRYGSVNGHQGFGSIGPLWVGEWASRVWVDRSLRVGYRTSRLQTSRPVSFR